MAAILRILLALAFYFALITASPVGDRRSSGKPWDNLATYALHERQEVWHSEGWTRIERADPKAILPMRIGLTQSNLEKGHELLMTLYVL
jgi:hypothetical protein